MTAAVPRSCGVGGGDVCVCCTDVVLCNAAGSVEPRHVLVDRLGSWLGGHVSGRHTRTRIHDGVTGLCLWVRIAPGRRRLSRTLLYVFARLGVQLAPWRGTRFAMRR